MKNILIFSILLSATQAFSMGDELVKSWRGKQEAYYKGEALVESNSERAAAKISNLLKKYKWGDSKTAKLLHRLAELNLNIGRIRENNLSKKSDHHTNKALNLYSQLIAKYPKYKDLEHVLFSYGFELYMKRDFSKSYEILTRLNSQFPKSKYKFDALLLRADSMFETQKHKEAEKLFAQVRRAPEKGMAYYSQYKMAWSQFNQHHYEASYKSLVATILSKNANLAENKSIREEAIQDLALFYKKQNRLFNPYRDFKSVLPKKNLESSLRSLADLYYEDGSWTKAVKSYDQLIRHFSSSRDIADYHLKKGVALSTNKKVYQSSLALSKGLSLCKEKGCKSFANDKIFKLVNGWEKYWRKNKEDRDYLRSLKKVYPPLALVAESGVEQSKIYLLLAELEVHTKSYLKASYAYEKSYNANQKADYSNNVFWQSIYSLTLIKNFKWNSKELSRLEKLVASYINKFSEEKKAIFAQNFLAETYIKSDLRDKATELYSNLSYKYMYSKSGEHAYNQFLKVKVADKKYDNALSYLLKYRKTDKSQKLWSRVNKDLDSLYDEWSQLNLSKKDHKKNIKVYHHALKNRPKSHRINDWMWNLAYSYSTEKKHYSAAKMFLNYEKNFANKDKKQILALENAYSSLMEAGYKSKSLKVSKRLESIDRERREAWILASAKLEMSLSKEIEAYRSLSKIKKDLDLKNQTYADLVLKKLSKKELRQVLKEQMRGFSRESRALTMKRLILKIADVEEKETRDLARRLSKVKVEDPNLNAYGHYIMAVHDMRVFSKKKHKISSDLDRTLESMIKEVLQIDEKYRRAIELSTDSTQVKSLIGLGAVFSLVPKKFYEKAKKLVRKKKPIHEIHETIKPFFTESYDMWRQAEGSLRRLGSKHKEFKSIRRSLDKSVKYARRLQDWYQRNDKQILLTKGGR